MTTWKKTKKRRVQKTQEQKQAAASAARYEEDLRARQAAEDASWKRHREMIEASRVADPATQVSKADEVVKAENPPSPRPAPPASPPTASPHEHTAGPAAPRGIGDGLAVATATQGEAVSEPKLLFCGVRDGGDFWHLECRFDDGQKYAAVQVSIEHEKLADDIAAYLNTRKEREQAQGLTEIRIRQLGEQLAACEKALAERDARVLVLDKTVWGLVHNAGRCITSGRVERWVAVMNAVGCGSTQAHELCRQHGLDPDELVGRGDLCGGCEEDGGTCGGCICDDEVSQNCTRSDEDLGGHGCECERSESQELKREKVLAKLHDSGITPTDLRLGSWECEGSPTGECAYDADEDPCLDDCLFCHEPDERK